MPHQLTLSQDLISSVKNLSDEQAGDLLKGILIYSSTRHAEFNSIAALTAFQPIKKILELELKRQDAASRWDDLVQQETKRERRRLRVVK
jgi:hypothetical protein